MKLGVQNSACERVCERVDVSGSEAGMGLWASKMGRGRRGVSSLPAP